MELEVKKELLGASSGIHATYNHVADVKELNQPLEEGTAIRVFCHGSGTIFGIDLDQATGLLNFLTKAPEEEVDSFAGHYFHVGTCGFCDGKESYVEIKKIPRLDEK